MVLTLWAVPWVVLLEFLHFPKVLNAILQPLSWPNWLLPLIVMVAAVVPSQLFRVMVKAHQLWVVVVNDLLNHPVLKHQLQLEYLMPALVVLNWCCWDLLLQHLIIFITRMILCGVPGFVRFVTFNFIIIIWVTFLFFQGLIVLKQVVIPFKLSQMLDLVK